MDDSSQNAVTHLLKRLEDRKEWGCYPCQRPLLNMNKNVEMASFDVMADALASVKRRKLLLALLERNPQDDLVSEVADPDSDGVATDRRITMRHVHLPKLEEYGFINWDRNAHEVMKGPTFDEIRPLLELLENHEAKLPADML